MWGVGGKNRRASDPALVSDVPGSSNSPRWSRTWCPLLARPPVASARARNACRCRVKRKARRERGRGRAAGG